MRFRRLTLKNFGAYLSEQEFCFDVKDNKNVILIGGKNGAGKTTILEAMRIALYGPFAYGYKSENESYKNKIYSFLNKTALKNNENVYQVFLEFDYVEDLQRSVYIFKRQWQPIGNQIKEEFSIIKDGTFINDPKETDIIQTKILQVLPPKLFELCLFDGETISRIITDEIISDYLHEIFFVLYNLDLFTNLNKDIETLKKQLFGREDPDLYKKYETLIDEIEKIRVSKMKTENTINQLINEVEEKQNEVIHLKRKFAIYGGLMREERDKLLNQLYALEQERKELSERIKEFINGIFPFYIVREELKNVSRQMEFEQKFEAYEYFSSIITTSQVNELLRKLDIVVDKEQNDLGSKLLKEIHNIIRPDEGKLIHRASFSQRSGIQIILNEISQLNPEQILKWFSRSNELLLQIQEIRKKLDLNDAHSEFQEITNKIQVLSNEIVAANIQVEKLQNELDLLNQKVAEKEKEKHQLENRLSNVKKNQTTLKNIEKIIKVSEKFVEIELKDKIEQVQSYALMMFKELLRKVDYIERIEINPTTFELSIYSPNNTIIENKMLSAGEKQILLLSLIWSIVKVSGKNLPFVFDTLLGRLDQNHKSNVLSKLIPNCGKQVIILSTDSEIDQHHFELLLPYISSVGTLENDPITKSAKYEPNKYFECVTV